MRGSIQTFASPSSPSTWTCARSSSRGKKKNLKPFALNTVGLTAFQRNGWIGRGRLRDGHLHPPGCRNSAQHRGAERGLFPATRATTWAGMNGMNSWRTTCAKRGVEGVTGAD